MGDVIINEIELDPVKGQAQWIELYNPTDMPISLESFEMQFYNNDVTLRTPVVITFSEDDLIGSEEYYVVSMKNLTQSSSNTYHATIVLLDLKAETLDTVQGLGDTLADDKTWQRFPDGMDSDTFGDWTFRPSTSGQSNGNLGHLVAECSLDPFCWGPLDVFFHNKHRVTVDDRVFLVETFYDTKRTDVDFVLEEKKITISQKPPNFSNSGTGSSFMHVTIPDELLGGTYSVFADGKQKIFYVISNQPNNRIIINDIKDAETIEIIGTRVIPEFSSESLFIVAISVFSGLVVYRHYASRLHSSFYNTNY